MGLVEWAYETSRARLAEELPCRWNHVQSVADEAQRISRVTGGNGELLVAAAMLHDVGYASGIATTGFHPLDAARYLAGLDVDHRLCCLVARHSCAIREAEMRGLQGDLERFEDEATPTRDALWYCDMVTGPGGARVHFHERVAEIQQRYGPDHLVSRFIRVAEPELAGAVERTRARMQAAGIGMTGGGAA